MRPVLPRSQVAFQFSKAEDAPPLTAEQERLTCCALYDVERQMRFCKAHVTMKPANDSTPRIFGESHPQPCLWTIIEAAKEPGNPEGITDDVLAQANEANQKFISEAEQADANAKDEQAKTMRPRRFKLMLNMLT